MITARTLRAATAAAATTALLALAGAFPATAAPAQENSYPQDRGVYTLTTATPTGSQLLLTDTNWVYAHHPQARDVVASPRDRQTSSQQWQFIEVSEEHFRLINVQTGRALQRPAMPTAMGRRGSPPLRPAGTARSRSGTSPASASAATPSTRSRIPLRDRSTAAAWSPTGSLIPRRV